MSKVLLVSDIHANLAALDAVLRDAERHDEMDAVWSLGDTVGYGPQPSECLMRLKQIEAVAISGNHELAALEAIPIEDFNPYAKQAAEWTTRALTDEARTYAQLLPQKVEAGEFTLVHGSPRDPVWEYVVDPSVAAESVPYLNTANCANGHTHVPGAFLVSENEEEQPPSFEDAAYLAPGAGHWFINPGSVGQPRDGDPRAAYAVLDDETMVLRFFRVEYPVKETQALMEQAGLPTVLYERLAYGF